MTNSTKTSDYVGFDDLKDLCHTIGKEILVPATVMIVGAVGKQVLEQVIIESWWPSQKTVVDIDSATKQAAMLEAQGKEADLSVLDHKLKDLEKAYPDKDERELMKERILKEMRDKIKADIPDLTDEDKAKIAEKKAKKSRPSEKKPGLISKLKTNFLLAAESAGKRLDVIADKTFAHVTKHDSFKDTFVEVHAKMINRGLVGISGAVLLYGMYKLYNKYTSDDYDVYDNDADDDDDEYDDE